ncbi:uncharacterized protein F4822DRAFT_357324 [Hypoxylon trugodes]|uniref:uncharacterized protein n=1 Tax=Hypoxylon trugodes TaxID=326681 RepID=UPI0021951D66|nr:uncharacterized protein F4822DRAFT_357324 [Hypoxylon trugodes]KAI1385898.1 hypothetical protein F4822DRAFT_357324 [Hypoxylon trugodes]
MKSYEGFLTFILAGLAVADTCTTSTVSFQPSSSTASDPPASTSGSSQISLEVTGCSKFSNFSDLTVARVNIYNNSFTEINLANVRITDQIRIANNPNLEKIVLPDPRPGQTIPLPPTGTDAPTWTDVEIAGNPQLDSDNITYQGGASFWDWGVRNLSSFVFIDGNFHSNFFYPISTSTGSYPEKGHVYVTSRFIVNSTDSLYDCGYLNSVRYYGSIKGNYTCQGRTVMDGLARGISSSHSSNALLGALVVAVCFVGFL